MERSTVVLAEDLSPATIRELGPECDVVVCDGTDRAALREALASAQAVVVRSATRMDAEAIGWGPQLKVIARAGVGLDNIDVAAATAAGVMVVNAPTSNITSAAELAVGLILALLRKIPQAHASLTAGQWNRKGLTGREVWGSTVGIIGFGRIGQLVAERMAGFGVQLLAFDPYGSVKRAGELGVRLVDLPELLRCSDVVTVHVPRTPDTAGLIDANALALMKPSASLINASRGGIVDEKALAEALQAGSLAGAALDVFAEEPCTSSPLFDLPQVVVTPHLGASTHQAQEKAGVAVARSVRLALQGELVPDAVNVPGGAIAPPVRPALGLTERLARVFVSVAGALPPDLVVEVRGELAGFDVATVELAALKGVLTSVVSRPVTYVNARSVGESLGMTSSLVTSHTSEAERSVVRLRGAVPDGRVVTVAGAVTGLRAEPKLVGLNGFEVEVALSPHLVVMEYHDRPGVVGVLGRVLGDQAINIAGMQVARNDEGRAIAVITTDSAVPASTAAVIGEAVGVSHIAVVDTRGPEEMADH